MWTALTEIFRFLNNLFAKVFNTPQDQIRKLVAIYDAMHEMIEKTSVERILIFKAHNGGGIIKPTGEFFVTALYEDYTEPFSSTKSNYIRFPVDKDYAKMILDVIETGKVDLLTSEMPSCILKGVYVTEGVINAKVYFLRQDRKSVYYMSVASSTTWPPGPQTDSILNILVNKIRQNIK